MREQKENKNIFNFPIALQWVPYRRSYFHGKKVRNKLISMTKTNAVQVKSIHVNLFILYIEGVKSLRFLFIL